MGTVWVVAEANGDLRDEEGWFRTREECETHIKETLCSAEQNDQGEAPGYMPVAIKAYEQNDYFMIVNSNGTLRREHGFFTSHRAATAYIEARLDPPADREYDRPATHHARQVGRAESAGSRREQR